MDTVRIPPWSFHRQLNDAIAEELNKKLANKVSRAHDVTSHASDPYIRIMNAYIPEFNSLNIRMLH